MATVPSQPSVSLTALSCPPLLWLTQSQHSAQACAATCWRAVARLQVQGKIRNQNSRQSNARHIPIVYPEVVGRGSLCDLGKPQAGVPMQPAPHHDKLGPLLTVAALWVGISKSSEAGLAQVTALSLYILLAHTLAGHWVTGSPWNCPIWVTLAS
jgi:hypothetical protein